LLTQYNIEIGTSFGPLHGRIWRIGTMGYNAREDAVRTTLDALENVLSQEKHKIPRGAAADAAATAFREG
jgi:(S)-ureidoglycine---glyoxylate transaminase